MPWFRWYVETTRDHKIRREPLSTRWAWVAVLTLCRKSPQPPKLLLSEGVPVTVEDIADEANITVRAAQAAVDLFTAKRMIERAEGVWSVLNWARRQPNSDNVAERVERHRERLSNVTSSAETADGNVTETAPDIDAEVEGETEPPNERPNLNGASTADRQARVQAMARAVPKPGEPGAPDWPLWEAFASALGCDVPTSPSARRKWLDPIWELHRAGVTADEIGDLVKRFDEDNDVRCSPQGVANQLPGLRAPARPKARGKRDEPRGYEGLREHYADLDPQNALEAAR